MKIRNGFVSNSSSSSFLVNLRTKEELGEIESPSKPKRALGVALKMDEIDKALSSPTKFAVDFLKSSNLEYWNLQDEDMSPVSINGETFTLAVQSGCDVVFVGLRSLRKKKGDPVDLHRPDPTEEDCRELYKMLFGPELGSKEPIDMYEYGDIES